MNWVGGARSRIKSKNSERKQREFFKKRRLETANNSRKPKTYSTPTLSRDLLTFNLLQIKSRKVCTDGKPTKVIKQDLEKKKGPKVLHVNLPETPLDTDKYPCTSDKNLDNEIVREKREVEKQMSLISCREKSRGGVSGIINNFKRHFDRRTNRLIEKESTFCQEHEESKIPRYVGKIKQKKFTANNGCKSNILESHFHDPSYSEASQKMARHKRFRNNKFCENNDLQIKSNGLEDKRFRSLESDTRNDKYLGACIEKFPEISEKHRGRFKANSKYLDDLEKCSSFVSNAFEYGTNFTEKHPPQNIADVESNYEATEVSNLDEENCERYCAKNDFHKYLINDVGFPNGCKSSSFPTDRISKLRSAKINENLPIDYSPDYYNILENRNGKRMRHVPLKKSMLRYSNNSPLSFNSKFLNMYDEENEMDVTFDASNWNSAESFDDELEDYSIFQKSISFTKKVRRCVNPNIFPRSFYHSASQFGEAQRMPCESDQSSYLQYEDDNDSNFNCRELVSASSECQEPELKEKSYLIENMLMFGNNPYDKNNLALRSLNKAETETNMNMDLNQNTNVSSAMKLNNRISKNFPENESENSLRKCNVEYCMNNQPVVSDIFKTAFPQHISKEKCCFNKSQKVPKNKNFKFPKCLPIKSNVPETQLEIKQGSSEYIMNSNISSKDSNFENNLFKSSSLFLNGCNKVFQKSQDVNQDINIVNIFTRKLKPRTDEFSKDDFILETRKEGIENSGNETKITHEKGLENKGKETKIFFENGSENNCSSTDLSPFKNEIHLSEKIGNSNLECRRMEIITQNFQTVDFENTDKQNKIFYENLPDYTSKTEDIESRSAKICENRSQNNCKDTNPSPVKNKILAFEKMDITNLNSWRAENGIQNLHTEAVDGKIDERNAISDGERENSKGNEVFTIPFTPQSFTEENQAFSKSIEEKEMYDHENEKSNENVRNDIPCKNTEPNNLNDEKEDVDYSEEVPVQVIYSGISVKLNGEIIEENSIDETEKVNENNEYELTYLKAAQSAESDLSKICQSGSVSLDRHSNEKMDPNSFVIKESESEESFIYADKNSSAIVEDKNDSNKTIIESLQSKTDVGTQIYIHKCDFSCQVSM